MGEGYTGARALRYNDSKRLDTRTGVVKVGALDADQHGSFAKKYGVSGFPTIKIFTGSKHTPYQGQRTAEGFVEAALKAAKEKVFENLGKKTTSSSDKSDVITLTDSNFKELVLDSEDMWLVEFFAPWCGHCKNLEPHWAKAASELKGKIKVGALDATVHTSMASQYQVQGYPTIKFFPAGKKGSDSAEEYTGGRTSSDIVTWALDKLAENVSPPEIIQVVNEDTMKACSEKPLCVVSVLPHILDCGANCRNDYLGILTRLGEKYKNKMWGWVWCEAGAQLGLENALELGGFGYPAMAVVNAKKLKFSTLRGAFSESGINEFLRDLSFGRGQTAPVRGAEMPKIETTEPWDGKDGVLPAEEDIDLSDHSRSTNEQASHQSRWLPPPHVYTQPQRSHQCIAEIGYLMEVKVDRWRGKWSDECGNRNDPDLNEVLSSSPVLTSAKKRRIRRKKLQARLNAEKTISNISDSISKNGHDEPVTLLTFQDKLACDATNLNFSHLKNALVEETKLESNLNINSITMSSNRSLKKCKNVTPIQQTKTQAKQNSNEHTENTDKPLKLVNNETNSKDTGKAQDLYKKNQKASKLENSDSGKSLQTECRSSKQILIDKNKMNELTSSEQQMNLVEHEVNAEKKSKETMICKNSNSLKIAQEKSKDEVDRAIADSKIEAIADSKIEAIEKSREQIKADREAKKLAKQAKKKGQNENCPRTSVVEEVKKVTNKNVAETLANIVEVVKDVQEVAIKVNAITLDEETKPKPQEGEQQKSKAELRAERRAKQEAQRAAKSESTQNSEQIKVSKGKTETMLKTNIKSFSTSADKNKKSVNLKQTRVKTQHAAFRVDWFEHLYPKVFENPLNNVPLNSELHPAIVKLGVQLNTGVVFGSNARCVALLNSMKHVISDYKVPDKTEFARGLESHLTTNANFLWTMREPNAAQTNAMNFLRFHLTDLIKKNIEDDEKNSQAKKLLLGEIDKYVGDQIDKAEKILCDAWEADLSFHAVVTGSREAAAGREMLRRLAARRLPVTYVDITALSFAMRTVDKVIVGASSVLMNGSVLGAAGTLQVALVARAHNVPLLVCCETHKFSDKVLTDAFVYNELGDPRDLVDEESPIKDWRSRVNLNVLNLMYDVTPANLVTAVVTELDILPCTSAPVVHRIKLTNN
ncbi:Protein disulfide-isomerase A6 homolog [Eumeta japonica]|uniref:protein disulfide-isomerase n=1 Tax=Eumeta variegata TaxID=151549 RepID=A0A4C1URF5_EUMVA|nr:Protein disulfide-isomerase A6 homolog [Eumeta japonica]